MRHVGDDLPLLASPAPHVGLASPSPAGTSPCDTPAASRQSLSWKRLLVNSPPAWAASPEHVVKPQVPPFPWPAQTSYIPDPPRLPPSLRQPDTETPSKSEQGEGHSVDSEKGLDYASVAAAAGTSAINNATRFSQDEEQEIFRFLSHCSMSSEEYAANKHHPRGAVPPKTPSPRRRGSLTQDDTMVSTGVWTPFSATAPSEEDSSFSCRFREDVESAPWAKALAEGGDYAFTTPTKLTAAASLLSPPLAMREAGRQAVELGEVVLRSCSCCGRRFRESRLPVHEAICFRSAGTAKRRSIFESSRQRCTAVSGRWWSNGDPQPTGNQSRQGHPPTTSSPQVPGRGTPKGAQLRRSRSVPSTRTPGRRSPGRAPSPRPSQRRAEGAPKTSGAATRQAPTPSPQKPERPRSCSGIQQAKAEVLRGQRDSVPRQRSDGPARRDVRSAGPPRRVVSVERRFPFTSPAEHAARVDVNSQSQGCAVQAPAAPSDTGRRLWSNSPEAATEVVSAQGEKETSSGLLGSIIEDVAQLSAQVERLLSRRKDLLTGPQLRSRMGQKEGQLELSPSDSGTLQKDNWSPPMQAERVGSSASC